MAFYVDGGLERLTLPMVRASLRPKAFHAATHVTLERFGFRVEARLVRRVHPTAFGGERVYFECPRCGRGANVLAVMPWVGWGCTGCLRWRWRKRPAVAAAAAPG